MLPPEGSLMGHRVDRELVNLSSVGMKGIKAISMGVLIDAARNYYLFRKEYNDNHHTSLLVNEDLSHAGSAFVAKFLARTSAGRLLKLIDKAKDKEGGEKIE